MELDEFKNQIRNKLATDHVGRSDADIASLLNRRTVSVIDKLKRSLWFEIFTCILVILFFAGFGIFSKWNSLRIYFSVFALLAIAFLVIIIYLLRRINELGGTTLPVKSNLQTIVKIIEDFTRRYFQFTMALIPVCFVFAAILGYNDRQPIPELDHFFGPQHSLGLAKVLVIVFIYMLILGVIVYYFTKWYLKKLYYNYLTQLRACIDELQETGLV